MHTIKNKRDKRVDHLTLTFNLDSSIHCIWKNKFKITQLKKVTIVTNQSLTMHDELSDKFDDNIS